MKCITSMLHKLRLAASAPKTYIAELLEEEEIYTRLRIILSSTDEYTKALQYCKSSAWSIEELTLFVQITGILPPEEAKMIPGDTLTVLKLARYFRNPEYIKKIKQAISDISALAK